MKSLFFFFSLLIWSNYSLAVTESQLNEELYFNEIIPTLTEKAESHFFKGKQNKNIHYYHYKVENPKALLVIVPGQAEPALRSAELVYDLKDENVEIYIIDHRGQGKSDRLVPDHLMSHVDHFTDYVDDLNKFIFEIVKPETYKRSVLFCHSMGGVVCSGHLLFKADAFDEVVMTSPMMKVNTPMPEVLALSMTKTANALGCSKDYAMTQKPYNFNTAFEGNITTSSETRFYLYRELLRKNPDIAIGGTSNGWSETTLEYSRKIRKTPHIFNIPTTIFQATADKRVKPEGQNEACGNSPTMCRIVPLEGSRHSISMEKDQFRNQFLDFLKRTL